MHRREQNFYANHRWFFTLGALLAPIDAVDTLLKGRAHFIAQGPLYVITLALVLVLNIVAARPVDFLSRGGHTLTAAMSA